KPPQGALVSHFTQVADEGDLPVILYNVPGRTSCALTADTILELAEHPRIVGVKEASADLDLFQTLLNESPDGFSILSGDDAWTAPVMLLGAHGVVSVAANVVPRAMSMLVQSATNGDLKRTRRLQSALLPLFRALFCTTNPIPVKRAAEMMGHAQRHLRMPLTAEALTASMVSDLETALETARAVGEDQ
ncbi:MAG: dihydrodipicolinate synthase family protein, partial [Myxococcota bacterium]|nr:dihydrodipicolinate synthase family protein [Myxococcota bacterium]